MASPSSSGAHLQSLLKGLTGAGSPSVSTPERSAPSADMNDPNSLLRLLAGTGPATPPVHSPLPPVQAGSPTSPGQPTSLLDLLNQRPSGQQQRSSMPSPAFRNGGELSPSAARSDISQAGSLGGRLGGTSLMEMLMGGLPIAPSSDAPSPQHETLSPPPATSMNPLLSAQQQRPTRPNGYGLVDTSFTSPSPPPSEAMALRIEPQAPVTQKRAEPEPIEPQQSQPSPFSFVSPFDAAFGPPAGKRSKSVQPPSMAATSSAPLPSPSAAASATQIPRSTSFHSGRPSSSGAATDGKLAIDLFPSAPTPPTPPLAASDASTVCVAPLQPSASLSNLRPSDASVPIAADGPLGHTRTGSGSLRVRKGDIYPSGKWRAKLFQKDGLAGRANVPDRQRNTAIQISNPNLETLVADSEALAKRPISIIRSELIYQPGRTVDGSTFISYAMNKGRVRLIDEASGARALLKLPTEWYRRDAQVADLATQDGLVAAITTDGGLVVWRVPTSWVEDDPECTLVCATKPAEQDDSRLVRLRWVSSTRLAVCSASAVWFVEVERGSRSWTCDRPLELEAFERAGTAVRITGQTIVDFAVHPTANGGTQVAIIAADGSLGLHVVSASDGVQTFWHGHLTSDVPSSVELLDSDLLLLGTKRGTVLRLFSLAVDASGGPDVSEPFDEVRFEVPDATANFGKIEVDRRRDLVWVSNTARCSLYALRLNRGDATGLRPLFGRVVEFALDDPVTSFVVKATDADAFVVSPNGVDMLTFTADALERLLQPAALSAPITNAALSEHEIVKEAAPSIPVVSPSTIASAPPPPSAAVAAAPAPAPAARHQMNGSSKTVKDTVAVSEDSLGRTVRKELVQVEDSLFRRFSSSLQLQSERLETADLRRQEKIFAVLAQELGTNHSALVTEAVKAELHAAILPTLSTLVQAEVRSILQQEVARGVAEAINSRTVFLSIDKAVKDLASKTLIPSFDSATAAMGATLTQEIREDMTGIRKEIVREQSGALLETNDLLSEMTSKIQALGKQVAELQGTVISLQQQVVAIPQHPRQRSPVESPAKLVEAYPPPARSQHQQQRQPYVPSGSQVPSSFSSAPFGNPPQRSPLIQAIPIHPASLAYPQPIGPGPGGPPPFSPGGGSPYSPAPVVDWGDVFTETFLSSDPNALSNLTRRIGSNLDAVLPDVAPGARQAGPEGRGPLSQAVLLTTVHKFTESLPRASANTADFASAVVVIGRASRLLDSTDPTIIPYAQRVIAQVVPTLARTEAELAQAAAGSAGPPGSTGERTRLFFADGLRSARVELQNKAARI